MARRKANKSAQIRKMLETLGGQVASPKAVVEALAKEGFKVPTGLVSNIKHAIKLGKSGRKPSGKRGGRTGVNGQAFSVANLLAAKQLVDALGSVEAAESALAALAKLQ